MMCKVDDFQALAEALERMCAALEGESVPENAVFDCKVVAMELLSNALRYGGGCTAFFAEKRGDSVVIRVRSANNFRPPEEVVCSPAESERGRGLFLVDALSAERTFSEEEGICVVVRIL